MSTQATQEATPSCLIPGYPELNAEIIKYLPDSMLAYSLVSVSGYLRDEIYALRGTKTKPTLAPPDKFSAFVAAVQNGDITSAETFLKKHRVNVAGYLPDANIGWLEINPDWCDVREIALDNLDEDMFIMLFRMHTYPHFISGFDYLQTPKIVAHCLDDDRTITYIDRAIAARDYDFLDTVHAVRANLFKWTVGVMKCVRQWNAVFHAAQSGDHAFVEWALEHGCPVDVAFDVYECTGQDERVKEVRIKYVKFARAMWA